MSTRQQDFREKSLRRKVEKLQKMVEDGLASPLQAVDIRRMTGTIEDIKTAHNSLDTKILDILDALQDQNQGKEWFEEWQAEVDFYTDWIYKWQYVLDEAVENHGKTVITASHPQTSAMTPVQQTCPEDRDLLALHAKEAAMIAPTSQEVTKIAPAGQEVANIVPANEEAIKLVPEPPRVRGQSSKSPPAGGQFPKLLPAGGQPLLPARDHSLLPAEGQSGGFPKSPPARGLSTVLPADGGLPDTFTVPTAKHEEVSECPGEDKLKLLVSRQAVEQIQGGNWIQDYLDHFLECHDDTVNYLKVKDCDDDILQDQNLFRHVGQCSQPDCLLIGHSNNETVNLIKLFMDRYKIRHPSPKPKPLTAVTLTGANDADPSVG